MTPSDLFAFLQDKKVELVAVSKTKPVEAIQQLYDLGQRVFAENKVQEILSKAPLLPHDIQWHMIGHLQKNKIKAVLPWVVMIQSVDSLSLLKAINDEAQKIEKTIHILLEVKIATEETKYGFDEHDVPDVIKAYNANQFPYVVLKGLMGMASFSEDVSLVKNEFKRLKSVFDASKSNVANRREAFDTISMGMSGDFELAVEEGSTMVRIGSLLFGTR